MFSPKWLTRDEARRVDALATDQLAIPGLLLMENAGRGVADCLEALEIRGPVVICCGSGNNGGDGFVVGRHLDGRGYEVRFFLWGAPDRLRGDARVNYEIVRRAEMPVSVRPENGDWLALEAALSDADWIVDALLGTGAKGAPRSPMAEDITILNRADARRLAIDLPSGLDADTGEAPGVVFRADHTVTFVAPKAGFQRDEARTFTGQVHVADIGLPSKIGELWTSRR